ncbi:synaptopodin-2 isoform X1 [Micropterus dolomieu]|uniref:synaptopodin-2 isoform X1 n=1 Tax=Micropterus dolomieu TaxID=147949 RepID=UPI001E8EA60A|nr:synaptopodin-2 isoform X1 [Micropterus dolomieu]XP_045902790.1 synaptopodin-2 isoform X1 [Micropterus dolomieu]
MEPEAEDLDTNDNLVPWSGSDGSQELCASESYYEDDASDAEYPLDPQPAHIQKSDLESPECLQSQDWESAGEQQSLPELSGSEEDVSYQEEDDIYYSESRESIPESPHIQTSPTSLSPHPEHADSEPHAGQISRPHSRSSSSSLGCAADMTLALTLTTEQPLGANNRQDSGTGNRRIESSEEGGSSEAPPASLFFGISSEAAEQAEKWNSESDTDLCRPDSHEARYTRLVRNESQSEKQVKETKSKCKRIARLLTDAPNPQNKGALLFKKRRQRVEKYTLVSYGTGENKFDSEDQIEEETEEVRSSGYNFVATSESEFEEEYSVYHQQQNLNLNWGSVREMEALPETKGKGVMMFAQRRKRMDEIVSEHEEMRSKGLPVEALTEPECTEKQNVYDTEDMYIHTDQANYMDANLKQHVEYQENIQQMNNLSSVPKPLVPNRTAKPFLGFQVSTTAPVMPGGVVPVTKKHEPRFRVPVPINTNPQVWSPTGDIIASRDERISVPAIKTGILPESKRKTTNKQASVLARGSDLHPQNKVERRSYVESEEDCFSLGAEACNFMQPRSIKLKNPPPVAPKPTINPTCPPWMRRSPSGEPCIPPRSPVSQPSHSSGGPYTQNYLQQQDWAQPQQMANHWAPDQSQATLQTPASAWAPVNSSSQLHLQPTTNSWSHQLPRSPVSMHACSPTYSPHHPPSPSRNKSDSAPHSVASCPPQAGKSFVHASKAAQASPKGRVSDKGINRAGDGPTMAGKGAELFAKRQSRMEKFVVDAETVQANKTRSPSPTSSLPNYWRYSSNVRAPPPLSYNPILAPFYPPSAAKQLPSTSPKIKPKAKEKPKAPKKHLNTLDIMKHQPYQLDSSLFKYDAVPEAKSPSPKPTPASKFEVIKSLKHRSASSHSPYNAPELAVQSKAEVPTKSPVSGFGRSRSLSLPRQLNSVPSPGLLSPVSTPGMQSSFLPAQRQTSLQEKVYKPLSPWEAASRSPIGSVDQAFVFQSLPSSIAANVKAAGQRRSLPEPPDEWKRRVSLDPAAVSKGHYHAAPAFQAPSMSRTFSPEKPAFYGPPFRPAQPVRPASRASTGYMGQGSSPTSYYPFCGAVQRS